MLIRKRQINNSGQMFKVFKWIFSHLNTENLNISFDLFEQVFYCCSIK